MVKNADSATFLVRDPSLPAIAEADDTFDSDSEENTPMSHKNFPGPGATPIWVPPASPYSGPFSAVSATVVRPHEKSPFLVKTHPILSEIDTVDFPTHGLSIPLITSEFGSILEISEKKMSLDPSAIPYSDPSAEHHGPSLAPPPANLSSSAVSHSSMDASLPPFADSSAIPTTVAMSTAMSAQFLQHLLEQHPAQHPEAFSESSKICFTSSTTTMPHIQPIKHGFHATMPSDCQHPACSPADNYNFQETLHPVDAI